MAAGHDRPIAVFLGPSCSQDEAQEILPGARFFPPAARGSIYGIINDGYRMIVLIDGLFYGQFSVWHKELLFALDCGIEVVGATSMGALRAAELDGAGMVGLGQIYRWYRDGAIDGDDEVALLHQNQEGGYLGLTVPLVNLRWNLARAVAADVIAPAQAALVLEHAKSLCFQERTIEAILAPFPDNDGVQAFDAWLRLHGEDLKHKDSLEALHFAAARMPTLGALPPPRLRPYEYMHACVGIEYFMAERQNSIFAKSPGQATPLAQFKPQLASDDSGHDAFLRARAFQRLVNGWARELHLAVAPQAMPVVWSAEWIDHDMRKATGLTPIDLARERQEAVLTAAVLDLVSPPEVADLAAEIDQALAARGWADTDGAERLVRLDGRLVHALWRLAQDKGIRPDADIDGLPAQMALRFADWIYAGGLQRFGYTFDPAAEILLAHQHANRLCAIALRAAS